MSDLTAADLAAMRERHRRVESVDEDAGGNLRPDDDCHECGEDWPCDAARLLEVVEALARAVAEEWIVGDTCWFCRRWIGEGHEPDCIVPPAQALVIEPEAGIEHNRYIGCQEREKPGAASHRAGRAKWWWMWEPPVRATCTARRMQHSPADLAAS